MSGKVYLVGAGPAMIVLRTVVPRSAVAVPLARAQVRVQTAA